MKVFREIILTFSLLLPSCGDGDLIFEYPRSTEIVYVCHNPSSIWHLSECNDRCLTRDYDGNAYCVALGKDQCERPSTEFLRTACSFYNY